MRATKYGLLLIAVVALTLAPAVGLAGAGCAKHAADKDGQAVAAADEKPCCAGHGCARTAAHAAMLASKAEGGCEKSAKELVAVAKNIGCEKAAALAAKAEQGDKEAHEALIAMFSAATEEAGEPSLTMLASRASAGCDKSAAALIAAAQKAPCAQTSALAEKAAHGCAKSKAALIAMYQAENAETAEATAK